MDSFGLWQKNAKIVIEFIEKEHKNNLLYLTDCLRWDWCMIAKSHYFPELLNTSELSKVKKQSLNYLRGIIRESSTHYFVKNSMKRAIYFSTSNAIFIDKYLNGFQVVGVINEDKRKLIYFDLNK